MQLRRWFQLGLGSSQHSSGGDSSSEDRGRRKLGRSASDSRVHEQFRAVVCWDCHLSRSASSQTPSSLPESAGQSPNHAQMHSTIGNKPIPRMGIQSPRRLHETFAETWYEHIDFWEFLNKTFWIPAPHFAPYWKSAICAHNAKLPWDQNLNGEKSVKGVLWRYNFQSEEGNFVQVWKISIYKNWRIDGPRASSSPSEGTWIDGPGAAVQNPSQIPKPQRSKHKQPAELDAFKQEMIRNWVVLQENQREQEDQQQKPEAKQSSSRIDSQTSSGRT